MLMDYVMKTQQGIQTKGHVVACVLVSGVPYLVA